MATPENKLAFDDGWQYSPAPPVPEFPLPLEHADASKNETVTTTNLMACFMTGVISPHDRSGKPSDCIEVAQRRTALTGLRSESL